MLRSRLVLGVGYGVAAGLTLLAIILSASPPQTGPLEPARQLILTLLILNAILIAVLLASVVLRLLDLLKARATDPGVRLHMRFVTLFALAAATPALVVAVLYGGVVSYGMENWFSKRVQTVVENSASAFRSYITEEQRDTAEHLNDMAVDLNREVPVLQRNTGDVSRYMATLASYHSFAAAYLVDRRGTILARAEAESAPAWAPPPPNAFQSADAGEIYVKADDVIHALYRLRDFDNVYLYVARPLPKGIVANLREAEGRLVSYRDVARNRAGVQFIFALSYAEAALLVLIGAVWLGLGAANAISGPIARLVQAAGRVAGGDLNVQVDADNDPEEIAVLSRAFNSMTHDLQVQQEALRRASAEAESRRQFIETVLAEVSAGVIGLDRHGKVSVVNRQAIRLLALPTDGGRGRKLAKVVPEFAPLVDGAGRGGEPEEEVDVVRGRESRRLRVRAGVSEGGLVLTFDDVTRLVAAQRNAAWRDVARRIAHEIKNPLTPIQLSAERLRKKYRKDIAESELETFDRCTDTIVRQVGDIGRMVDEFSAFARMPAPKFARADAGELIRAAVFAQRVASPDIEVEFEEPAPEIALQADSRMIGQALTNVLKNAAEAVEARLDRSLKGRISARLTLEEGMAAFEVEDNGVGLPKKDRDRLTEPYVTTREKGTGLGLAIVKRILEDHGGELELADARSGQGALAILRLPAAPAARTEPASRAVTAREEA